MKIFPSIKLVAILAAAPIVGCSSAQAIRPGVFRPDLERVGWGRRQQWRFEQRGRRVERRRIERRQQRRQQPELGFERRIVVERRIQWQLHGELGRIERRCRARTPHPGMRTGDLVHAGRRSCGSRRGRRLSDRHPQRRPHHSTQHRSLLLLLQEHPGKRGHQCRGVSVLDDQGRQPPFHPVHGQRGRWHRFGRSGLRRRHRAAFRKGPGSTPPPPRDRSSS